LGIGIRYRRERVRAVGHGQVRVLLKIVGHILQALPGGPDRPVDPFRLVDVFLGFGLTAQCLATSRVSTPWPVTQPSCFLLLATLSDFRAMGAQQSCLPLRRNPPQVQPTFPQVTLRQNLQSFPRVPNVRFRVLIIGRANAGKTSILQRVCDTTESPEIYRVGPLGTREKVCSRSWSHVFNLIILPGPP
jgi:hypothetical protein